ncbi:MAG: hypothetical protein HOV97_05975 [Nonomuraea sp.]|nr:hypothetical protein [Nonomuraea sp.]
MSTNFYMVRPGCPNACEHCSYPTALHIGKQSGMGGGKLAFGLQGFLESDYGRIGSWETWKKILREYAVEVQDEYHATYTVEDFIKHVERTTPKGRRRQYDWLLKHMPEDIAPDRYELDPDGFTVTFDWFE